MASVEQKRQRKEAQRRKEEIICSEYLQLKEQYPEETAYTLFDTLADKYRKQNLSVTGSPFPITGMGIREVIVRNGLYTPRKYTKKQCQE